MAHRGNGDSPIAVFSNKDAPGTVKQVVIPRTSAPALRIDTSQPPAEPIHNPYAGFEFTLQRYPLQDKTPSSSRQLYSHRLEPRRQQQGQQDSRPDQTHQQGQGDPRQHQATRPLPKEFYSRRHQRLRAQNPQQVIRGPTWGKIRQEDKFPPPVRPASISSHPDHSMYPSYKFIQPNFGIVHDYQRPLQTPVTAITRPSHIISPQLHTGPGSEPLTAMSLASGESLSFQPRSPLSAEPVPPKRSRSSSQAHEAYSRPLPLRQQIVSKRQRRTLLHHGAPRQTAFPTPTSNPIQQHPRPLPLPPPHSPSSSGSGYDVKETIIDFPMPPPPHPSANFFPFLRPVPASQTRASPRTTVKPLCPSPHQHRDDKGSDFPEAPVSSHSPIPYASREPGATSVEAEAEPRTAFRVGFKVPRINLSQKRPQASGFITPSMVTPKASAFAHHSVSFGGREGSYSHGVHVSQEESMWDAESVTGESSRQHAHSNSQADTMTADISSLALPYGHATPVVQLLNKSPFVHIVHGILAEARADPFSRPAIPSARPHGEVGDFQQDFDSAIPLSQNNASQPALSSMSSNNHRPLFRLPHVEPPNSSHLASCVEKYSTHIQALYHILPPQRLGQLVGSFLGRSKTTERPQKSIVADQDPFQAQVELAIEYLVFALGGLCWAKWDNTIFDSGPVFSDRATNILYHLSGKLAAEKRKQASGATNSTHGYQPHGFQGRSYDDGNGPSHITFTNAQTSPGVNEATQQLLRPAEAAGTSTSAPAPTLDLARAYLLAALLCGQLARIQDAAGHVRNAGNIVHFLIHRPGGEGGHGAIQGFYGLSLIDYNQYPHRLVEDERQLVALYWTCVQLEFEINAETGQAPSELLRYQTMVPTPDSDVLRFPHDNGDDTMMAGTEAVVGGVTESERAVIGGFKMQTTLRGHLNCIYGGAHGNNGLSTQEQKRKIDVAVANLRRQFDAVLSGGATLPHTETSVRTARACSAYWEARSYGVLFSLLKPQQQVDMEEMAEIVCSMTETIRAYHGLESDRLILPNAFGTAMLQCRYLLLLFAASRALPALAAFVDDASLRELIDHTLLSFQELLMFRDILEAARQVLRTIRTRLQPHVGSGPVLQPGPGTMPELSLYCPPFRTVPGIASSIPTASTMDSFISFPTPNSPHLLPSSAFTSPQHSPSISATSSSPSPRSATFVPGSLPFRPETMGILAPASGPGPISPAAVYPHPPKAAQPANALPIQAERVPANTADLDGLAYHLGLSLFGRG